MAMLRVALALESHFISDDKGHLIMENTVTQCINGMHM